MERSFAAQAGFEHEGELLTGYSDLVEHHEDDKEKTPEAVYTETVLKLDGGTYDIVDGQEGFLDNIKRGANKVYEWIKSMIRAIRNWFSGSNRKEYSTAASELKNLDIKGNFDKRLEMSAKEFDKHWAGALKDANRVLDSEGRQSIIRFVETGTSELKDNIEKKEKIIGTVINEISTKVTTRAKQIETRIAEINRIDPTGETIEKLGMSRDWNNLKDFVEGIEYAFSKEDQIRFGNQVQTLVLNSEEVQGYLSKAVSALDKMNEAARGNDAESRNVARAGSVVKELSEIASIFRDTVVTVNSQIQMGFKKAETSIVKAALTTALKESDDTANKYIQKAIDSL